MVPGRLFRWMLFALALGCAGTAEPEPESGRTVLAGTQSESVVVLPLNVTMEMPEQLEAGAPIVREELEDYLQAQGASLKTLAFPVARRFWLESIQQARNSEAGEDEAAESATFEKVAQLLVSRVAEHADFDMLIVPALFVQGATIEGRSVSWDGVQRTLEIDVGAWGEVFPEDPEISGVAPASSLHAAVLDAQGKLLQEGQGGIALLMSARARGSPESFLDSPEYQFVPRADPLADRDQVREGIALALSPLFPPLIAAGEE